MRIIRCCARKGMIKMIDHEFLLAISNMMDNKLEPIKNKMESIENRIESLEIAVKRLEDRVEGLENRIENLRIG